MTCRYVVEDIFDILQASPPVALAVGLNVLGYILKKSPVANWMIPIILSLLGALVFPYISDVGKINFQCRQPMVLLGVYGFCIGAGSVGLNQMARQFLGRKNDAGDTSFFSKKDVNNPHDRQQP